jgi:DHA1 family bicyclomycin/chloramphenicol resistance-like MFS transporter
VIVPSTFVLAMEGHPTLAGTASALIGTMNFAGGAVVVAWVAPFADGTPLPMVTGIAACSVIVFAPALRMLADENPAAAEKQGGHAWHAPAGSAVATTTTSST